MMGCLDGAVQSMHSELLVWCALGELLPGLEGGFVWGKARPASSLFVLLFCTLRGTVVLRERRD